MVTWKLDICALCPLFCLWTLGFFGRRVTSKYWGEWKLFTLATLGSLAVLGRIVNCLGPKWDKSLVLTLLGLWESSLIIYVGLWGLKILKMEALNLFILECLSPICRHIVYNRYVIIHLQLSVRAVCNFVNTSIEMFFSARIRLLTDKLTKHLTKTLFKKNIH